MGPVPTIQSVKLHFQTFQKKNFEALSFKKAQVDISPQFTLDQSLHEDRNVVDINRIGGHLCFCPRYSTVYSNSQKNAMYTHPQTGADQLIEAVNGARVCFNARAFLTNYYFSAPYDGEIRGIKFSYLDGSVSCWDKCNDPAKWGCGCDNDNYFYVSVIEVDQKQTWYPKNGQGGVSNYESLDCDGTKHTDKGVTVKRYRVPNEDGRNSNYWELKANVRRVSTTNRFAVQYGEGACANVKTNSGQACGRVRFIYSKIDTDQPTPQPTRSPIPGKHSSAYLHT